MSQDQNITTLDGTSSVDQSIQTNTYTDDLQLSKSTNTEDLSKLSVALKNYPVEQADWVEVNNKLRKHGFEPIQLLHPDYLNTTAGCTILSESSSKEIQKLLLMLMSQHHSSNDKHDSNESFSESLSTMIQSKPSRPEMYVQKINSKASIPVRPDEERSSKHTSISNPKEKKEFYDKRLETLEKEVNDLRKLLEQKSDKGQCDKLVEGDSNKPINEALIENEILHIKLKKSKKKVSRLKTEVQNMKTDMKQVERERCKQDTPISFRPFSKSSNKTYEVVSRNDKSTSNENDDDDFIAKRRSNSPQRRSYKANIQEAFQSLCYLEGLILSRVDKNWPKPSTTHVHSVHQLKQHIDRLASAYINKNFDEDENRDGPYKMLVDHFMSLFDVRRVNDVYTRMYDVYMRYYEDKNTLRSIKQILQIDTSLSNGRLVELITQLSKAKHLLKVKNVDKVILQLEKYDRFYLKFHELVKEIMYLLAVDSIDYIIPSLKVLLDVAKR